VRTLFLIPFLPLPTAPAALLIALSTSAVSPLAFFASLQIEARYE
jgi:hypothetical protein